MSNNRRKLDTRQISLFEMVQKHMENMNPKMGTLNISSKLKTILSKCISQSKYSVPQIACRMTEYLDNGETDGVVITHHMIYAWCSQSKEGHRIPADFIPAFCYAVESFEPIEFLAQQTDRYLMPGPEALRSEIQKIDEQMEKLKEEKNRRLLFLKETDK